MGEQDLLEKIMLTKLRVLPKNKGIFPSSRTIKIMKITKKTRTQDHKANLIDVECKVSLHVLLYKLALEATSTLIL
jgi:hypothetical protein